MSDYLNAFADYLVSLAEGNDTDATWERIQKPSNETKGLSISALIETNYQSSYGHLNPLLNPLNTPKVLSTYQCTYINNIFLQYLDMPRPPNIDLTESIFNLDREFKIRLEVTSVNTESCSLYIIMIMIL